MALFEDSFNIIAQSEINSPIDLLTDPLSELIGLPGIDGTEGDQDTGRLEIARQDKTNALLLKEKEKSAISTGPQNLAVNDSAGIATSTLLG